MPRSALEIKIPSAAARISSKLLRPYWFWILAIIFTWAPRAPSKSRTVSMQLADLTKEAATISIPCLRPKSLISASSLSLRVGRSMIEPGRLTIMRSVMRASFCTLHLMEESRTSVTSQWATPSPRKTVLPIETVWGRLL